MAARLIQPTPSAYGFPLLIKNLLRTPLIYSPDQEIIYRDQARFTYRQFGERVCRLASGLESLGVGPGATVAVMDWDSHRYLECFFAVPSMGAVLHTINIRLSPEQLIYTINHAEDDVILVNEEFLPMLEAVKDQFSTVKKIVLISDTKTTPQTTVPIDVEYEALLAGAAPTYDFPDLDENTMATTFYTTGTTGLPKGVFFSHRQLVLHTYAVITNMSGFANQANVNSADVYMPITPMFHVHAWGMPYVMTLLGAKQVYPGRYEPEMLLKLKLQEKVTFSHCVPTILHMLVSSPAVQKLDLSGWKVVIGGSALPRGLCKAALDLKINVYTGYGMSETCPVLTLAMLKPEMLDWDAEEQIKIRCRTGLPATNVLLEVRDANGKALPNDGKSTGEVVVRTPWLTQGYVKDPEKSEALWADGWLHTGDIGFIDELGYLQITDRLKDVIKTGGEWVSSLELEDIISRHPAVSEVAVIGVADEKWGERPVALVVPKPDQVAGFQEEEIKQFVAKFADDGVLPKYGVPDRVVKVDALPKTSVGKLNKKEMRKQFQG
ncbi:fatty acid--CoA ligase [Desulfatitalea alkaliphila]|uniref:Fatty acid--CoA ligase n=1 Tax=Desulfatitalea alkaliphila TaxID=2929485 RepID=A0AA41UQR5_9BACT|nr:fatty acid--CoA ligase [Desulfatitalea alkaliphila]MCJ8501628.1 fatty acid--CoA ligase [Desulfatitalea alkaliphila]